MNYIVLENSSIFNGLTREEIEHAIDSVSYHVEHYKKDTVIFRAMGKADQIGIILSGKAEAQKTFPTGSQVNVSIRTAGDLIGSAAAFSKAGRYPCNVVALEETSVLLFRKNDLLLLMADRRILDNFLQHLATATFMLQQKIELFSYSGIAQKTAFYLLMFHNQTGNTVFHIPKSVTNWAMMMNVSRPSLHRELTKMENTGLIKYTPPVIEILDIRRLEQLLT